MVCGREGIAARDRCTGGSLVESDAIQRQIACSQGLGERHQVDQLHLESGAQQDRTPEGAIQDLDPGGVAASYLAVVGAAALTCSHSIPIVTTPPDIFTFVCVPACLADAVGA